MADILRPIRIYRPFLGSGVGPSTPVVTVNSIEEAFVQRCVDGSLTTRAPAPMKVPEDAVAADYPYIVYHLADDELGLNLSGCDGTSTARFECLCLDDNSLGARNLAESLRMRWPPLVRANLYGIKIIGCWSERSSRDYEWADDASDEGKFQAQLDVIIRYRVAIPT